MPSEYKCGVATTVNKAGFFRGDYTKKDYPVNPDLCQRCIYKNRTGKINGDHMCEYITIVGHSKPKGSTWDNCVARETIRSKDTEDSTKT